MPISMSEIWEESTAIIKRERHLMIPLALATVGVGSAISGIAMPETRPVVLTTFAVTGLLLGNLLGLVGNLALAALVLKSGISVGESLRLAVTRLPTMIAIVVVFFMTILLMMLPLVALVGGDLERGMPVDSLPPLLIFGGLAGLVGIFYVGIRLTTLNALVVDRDPGIAAAIRESFAQTKGVVAKILGVFLLFLVVTTAATGAATAIFGTIFAVVGRMIATPLLGKVLTMLSVGMIDALFSMILVAFTATLYRRLSAE